MSLATALPVERIRAPLAAGSRIAAIDELLDELPLPDALRPSVRAAVLAREDELTTGIGGGVAIPHARVDGVAEPLLALGIAPRGVEFDSIDGRPVHLVFLLVSGAEQTSEHIALLAELCHLLNDGGLRTRLSACASAADAVRVLAR